MTHVFSVVFTYSVYWKQSMLCLRSGSCKSRPTEEGWSGYRTGERRASQAGCSLRLSFGDVEHTACMSQFVLMNGDLIYQVPVWQTSWFAVLYTVQLSAVLSNSSVVGLMETWARLSTALRYFFLKAKEEDVYSGAEDSWFLSFLFTVNFCKRCWLWFSKYKNSFKNNDNLCNSNLLI